MAETLPVETKEEPGLTRKNLLVSAGILCTFAAGMIVRVTFWGDPANTLHAKSLDSAFSLIWLAAAVLGGTIVTALVPLVRK